VFELSAGDAEIGGADSACCRVTWASTRASWCPRRFHNGRGRVERFFVGFDGVVEDLLQGVLARSS